ncbi:hypothetical protein Bca4012_066622 [Brassica carinata]
MLPFKNTRPLSSLASKQLSQFQSQIQQRMIDVPSTSTISNGLPTDLVVTEKFAQRTSFLSVCPRRSSLMYLQI